MVKMTIEQVQQRLNEINEIMDDGNCSAEMYKEWQALCELMEKLDL